MRSTLALKNLSFLIMIIATRTSLHDWESLFPSFPFLYSAWLTNFQLFFPELNLLDLSLFLCNSHAGSWVQLYLKLLSREYEFYGQGDRESLHFPFKSWFLFSTSFLPWYSRASAPYDTALWGQDLDHLWLRLPDRIQITQLNEFQRNNK